MSMVLDVKGAYLKSLIEEEYNENLYICLPHGNIHKLTKYLYGLKQVGKEWNDNITDTLIRNDYLATEDASVFYRKENADFILMSIHVDDFYLIGTKQAMLDKLYNQLIIKYKDISRKSGNELSYLGFVIKRDNHNHYLHLTQPTYPLICPVSMLWSYISAVFALGAFGTTGIFSTTPSTTAALWILMESLVSISWFLGFILHKF